jgi:hypothetical protein
MRNAPSSNRFSGRLCRFGNSYRGGRGAATVSHDKNRYINKIASNLHVDMGSFQDRDHGAAGPAMPWTARNAGTGAWEGTQRFVIVAFPAAT